MLRMNTKFKNLLRMVESIFVIPMVFFSVSRIAKLLREEGEEEAAEEVETFLKSVYLGMFDDE